MLEASLVLAQPAVVVGPGRVVRERPEGNPEGVVLIVEPVLTPKALAVAMTSPWTLG
jgi:hypothetical protein